MRKMKKGLAIAAGIVEIFAALGAVVALISNIAMFSRAGYMMPAGEQIRIYGMGVVNIVLPVLLAVCCFRRKLGIFPGVVMGRKARSGRRFLGTNGATLWLWSCLPKPGAPGP